MGKCQHIDFSNWLATGFGYPPPPPRYTAQVCLAYVTVDLLCWCAVHTACVGVQFTLCTFASARRYCNPGPQRRSAKLPVAVASSLTCSTPYRHDFTGGTAHYVSRSVFCSFRVSQDDINTFLKKKKQTTSLQSNPPHHPSWRLLQTETITNAECEGETRRTHHAVCCAGGQFLQCSPLSERALSCLKGCWPRPLVLLV
jgi:endogenous inhibitor of DNA gyrase (YacG/DUF329 family)